MVGLAAPAEEPVLEEILCTRPYTGVLQQTLSNEIRQFPTPALGLKQRWGERCPGHDHEPQVVLLVAQKGRPVSQVQYGDPKIPDVRLRGARLLQDDLTVGMQGRGSG